MRTTKTLAAAIAMLALAACNQATGILDAGSAADSPIVLNLSPPNAAVGVDPRLPIIITFNHTMMPGMEALVVLHEASITGQPVAGAASWSPDRSVLTFTPTAPLRSRTTYVLHLSPSLRAATGQRINLAACARLGGQTVTSGMLGMGQRGGMMNGAWGSGMMGDGWRAADGTFGMIFRFTTA
ncbi:MAG: Ig-like domain-containing protein [Gemmatimonadaceae bacterium]